jgi:SET domain-containing protein
MLKKKKSKFEPGNFHFKVKRTKTGLGLFAMDEIPKGKCIIEYTGRVISSKEEYTINSKYLFEVTPRITIDGSMRSNKARYINHSCRPNAEIQIWYKRVWVMAKRKIKAGEEITYDYQKDYWEEYIKPNGCRCIKCQNVV